VIVVVGRKNKIIIMKLVMTMLIIVMVVTGSRVVGIRNGNNNRSGINCNGCF
jgi:hypothetical protein